MGNAPELSVVMGVYNAVATLPAALDSILSQEGVALELIVVDDGSTDGSAEVLDEASKNDARLKVVHKSNEGLTRALIEGCAMAAAPWIARQDADDVSLPGRLKAQLDRARQPDAPALVGCGARILAPGGEVMRELQPPAEPEAVAHLVLDEGQAISPHGSILFNRAAYEAVGGYRAAFYYAQDIDLTSRLAEQSLVSAVPKLLYEYRFSPYAISGLHGHFQQEFYRLIQQGHALRSQGQSDQLLLDQVERVRERCLRQKGQRGDGFDGAYFIGMCLLDRQSEQAPRYFRQALSARPWAMKAWLRWGQAVWRSGLKGKR